MAEDFAYVKKLFLFLIFLFRISECNANDILGCGGFVKSHVGLDFSKIEIGLYTKSGILKEKTECAPNNGYYFLPLYEKGEYILKVHPPAGWSFEPSEVELTIDGVTDQCSTSQDINFSFNGFGITGKVITAGQQKGPAGISVQLVDNKGEVRNTVTTVGGDFHFTPVIPGKYTVKASHPRWSLDPAQAVVQVKEGNTVLPIGVLAVKGYDVKGSVTAFGSPISGVYILLYSKEASPKFRVEGCNTAMLQGLPDSKDSPICHSTTDANGEFSFGLVPAGEYRLMVLPTPPGHVTYIVKPEKMDFSVGHDSLYIKNAFEVTGFTLVSSSRAAAGVDVSGAQVLLDGQPVANTDAEGKFTLPNLQPGTYTMRFQHEKSVFDTQLSVTQNGNIRVVGNADTRWRVCGSVTPAGPRRVIISGNNKVIPITPGDDGKWCTFLTTGTYTAKVEVSEQEQRDGLQFYPVSHKLTIKNTALEGISFSQLKGELTGNIVCSSALCDDITVTLRPLSADGGYVGKALTMKAKGGKYKFSEVLPGSVEISVPSDRLCWKDSTHNVVLTQQHASVPDFVHTGYVLKFHSSHDIEVAYKSDKSTGVLHIPRGPSQQCVQDAGQHTLTPRGCHRFQPDTASADTAAAAAPPTIQFQAVAHAVVIRVTSPEPAQDLQLRISMDTQGIADVGPLDPRPMPSGGYVYEHTLYMADGEVSTVQAVSSSLLMEGGAPVQLLGRADCQLDAVTLRAVRALTLKGRILPPVAGVTITLTSDDFKLIQTTTEDGTYRFGPLDASRKYEISAEKESYVFSSPDENGDIAAHKLAEITVELLDEADNTPLPGAPVSVSGGSYRRVQAAGADGRARFSALHPADYYVKPHAKEYRFTPAHHVLSVPDGQHHHLTLKGRRVAWSCVGAVASLGGAGVAAAALLARPHPHSPSHCAAEDATTDSSGNFRIRGLLPGCVYTIELKESTNPELAGLKLVKAPAKLEVKDNKDIENVRIIAIQPQQLTDVNVLVHTRNIDHYKTLRLTLAADSTPNTPIYSTKLDPAGYSQFLNPGLMYVLPRLPADNKTYVLQLESTLSKATHVYDEEVHYFVSDGKFKAFDIQFTPKVKSSEQELRQTSLLVVPLLLALALAYYRRRELVAHAVNLAGSLAGTLTANAGKHRADRPDILDKASIDHIVSTVNAAGKRTAKKKQ